MVDRLRRDKVRPMETTTVDIEGLGATSATAHIEKALEAVPRVASVRMDTGGGKALIEHDGADKQALLRALRSVGYDQAHIE